jgi:regulator of sigma E protease
MSWLLAFAGFAVLIILHELGHFTAAKAVGMRVERFALFFPPVLARRTVGETEYALGAVPLGGYVKISGMSPAEHLPDEVRTRAYYAQPVWKRVVVIAAGPAVNVLVALILLFIFFWQVGPQETTGRVAAIERGYPAEGALRPGDRLLAVDGRRGDPAKFVTEVARHGCARRPPVDRCRAASPAVLLVERGGRRLTVRLAPIYDAQAGRTRLGFSYASDGPRKPFPFGQALRVTGDQFWFITRETAALPVRLFSAERRKQLTGVVGATEVTRQTILQDAAQVIGVLAIISLSLAIINLFPFLPLDGGHIFWAIVEKIRRRPVPFSVMERAGVVGFMLVIGLFLIGLTNDIGRLTGEGFNVR